MKKLIKIMFLLVGFFIFTKISIGQIPQYYLSAENFHPNGDFYTANEFTFDIKIRHTDSTRFEYAGGQYTINFNTQVANGGNLSYSFAGPDTSDLPSNLRPINPHIIPGSNISQLVLDVNNFPLPGNGFIIPKDSGITIVKMKLRTTAATFQMVGGTIGGWYIINLEAVWNNSLTKIYAFIGSSPVEIAPFISFIDNSGLSVNPVDLLIFTSYVNKNIVTLNWNTAIEINNFGFDIERKAVDGQWKRIGFVTGNGTTNEIKNYSFRDAANTGKYNYRLKQIDYNGNYEYFDLTDEVNVGVPQKFDLSQNFPNPFNPATKINFSIPYDEFVTLKVFDNKGREVSTLVNGIQSAGYYEINFDASHLSSGVYFYSLTSGGFTNSKRMVMIK